MKFLENLFRVTMLALFFNIPTTVLLATTGPGSAEYDKGTKAYLAKDYDAAIVLYKKADSLRNTDADQVIGGMYMNGIGVSKNFQQALKWFRKGASLGNAKCEGALGTMYYYGNGCPQDYSQAMR